MRVDKGAKAMPQAMSMGHTLHTEDTVLIC